MRSLPRAFYQGQPLEGGRHWRTAPFPVVEPHEPEAKICTALQTYGFVQLRSRAPQDLVGRVTARVLEASRAPDADAGSWMRLTHERPVQALARGSWIEDLLTRVAGRQAVPESATYVRAVRAGAGSKIHVDIPPRDGPEGLVLKVWIALSAARAGDGGLFVIPGPGRPPGFMQTSPQARDAAWQRIGAMAQAGLGVWLERHGTHLVAPLYAPGDVFLFDGLTVHGSFDKRVTGRADARLSVDTGWQFRDGGALKGVGETDSDPDSYARFLGSPNSWPDHAGPEQGP